MAKDFKKAALEAFRESARTSSREGNSGRVEEAAEPDRAGNVPCEDEGHPEEREKVDGGNSIRLKGLGQISSRGKKGTGKSSKEKTHTTRRRRGSGKSTGEKTLVMGTHRSRNSRPGKSSNRPPPPAKPGILWVLVLMNAALIILCAVLISSVMDLRSALDAQDSRLEAMGRCLDSCYRLSLHKFGVYSDSDEKKHGIRFVYPEPGSGSNRPQQVKTFPLETFIEEESSGN